MAQVAKQASAARAGRALPGRLPLLPILGLAAALAVAIALPFLFPGQTYRLARAEGWFIAILGLNILTGYTGQISLGHGAFMAIGGYTTGIIVFHTDVAGHWTIPLAGLVAGLVGFLFGFPALRLSGVYLALATFALAVAVPPILKRFEGVTGGSGGLVLDVLEAPAGVRLSPERWIYYLSLGILVVLFALAWILLRGRVGRALRAIHDSEVAAVSSGVNISLYKTIAFGISAAYAGVAGSLLVIEVGFVNPDTFPVEFSILMLVGLVVGGLGSLSGLVVGALFVVYLRIWAADISEQAPDLIYGAILIGLMFLLPTGAAGLLRRLLSAVTRGPIVRKPPSFSREEA